MSKYTKLGKNIGLITLGSFASKLLNVLFVPFYTAILSTAEYGIADIFSTTITLLFPVFTLMICEAMMRYALEDKRLAEKIYASGMFIWFAGFICLVILAPFLGRLKAFQGNISIFVMYYFSYSLYFNVSYFARGIEKVGIYAIAGIVQTAVAITLNILFLAVYAWGMKGYLFAYIIADFVAALFIIFGAKLYKYRFSAIDKQLLKKMLLLSLPMIPTQISWWITNSSNKYMLLYLSGAAIAGIFSISYKIPSIMNVLIGIFSSAWRISSVDGYGTEENKFFFNDIYRKYFSLSIIAGSLIMLLNKLLASFLYSKEFFIAYKYVPVLVLAVMLNGFSDFTGSAYIAEKKTNMLFYSTGIGAVINIILNYLLIPRFEAYGAAFATLLSYLAIWVIRVHFCKDFIKLTLDLKRNYLSLGLLTIEMILIIFDKTLFYFISAIICVAILLINRNIIRHFYVMFLNLIERWRK